MAKKSFYSSKMSFRKDYKLILEVEMNLPLVGKIKHVEITDMVPFFESFRQWTKENPVKRARK